MFSHYIMKNGDKQLCYLLMCFIAGCLFCKLARMVNTCSSKKPGVGRGNVPISRTTEHAGQSGGSPYVVYGTMRCPYTVKQLDSFTESGIPFEFKDTTQKDNANEMISITDNPNSGVPVTANTQTKKFRTGFMPANELMSSLN